MSNYDDQFAQVESAQSALDVAGENLDAIAEGLAAMEEASAEHIIVTLTGAGKRACPVSVPTGTTVKACFERAEWPLPSGSAKIQLVREGGATFTYSLTSPLTFGGTMMVLDNVVGGC